MSEETDVTNDTLQSMRSKSTLFVVYAYQIRYAFSSEYLQAPLLGGIVLIYST